MSPLLVVLRQALAILGEKRGHPLSRCPLENSNLRYGPGVLELIPEVIEELSLLRLLSLLSLLRLLKLLGRAAVLRELLMLLSELLWLLGIATVLSLLDSELDDDAKAETSSMMSDMAC